jgi:hypothetical protein
MALTRDQSIAKYGTEAYTAWDEPGAMEDAKAKGINVLQKRPNPAQLTSSATQPPFQQIKGFTELQNQYAQQVANQPDYVGLYQQYAQKEGLTDVNKLIANIDTSVADIEDKIAKVEPNINKEIGDYLITEGQRSRMVTAQEQPLRTQYADILRSRSRLSAEATAKANLVKTLIEYAQTSYKGRLDYLKSLVDIEASNKKTGSGGGYTNYLTPLKQLEPKPAVPPQTDEQKANNLLKGVTINDSGNVKTTNKSNLKFDKSGNLILGGGIQLTPTQKGKTVSTSTKFNRLSSNLA